jgi:AraC-like DNA-binding protein
VAKWAAKSVYLSIMHSIDHHLVSIRVTLELLPAIGYSVPPALEKYLKLDTDERNQALNLHQALSFHRTLIRYYPDPLLALHIAEAFPPQAYGMFGFGLLCSPSMRASLDFAVRFRRLTYTLMTLTAQLDPVYAKLCMVPANAHIDPELAVFFSDRDVAAAAVSFRSSRLTAVVPEKVTLVHDGFGLTDAYQAFFACEVEFGAPVASLMFSAAHLDTPSPYRNAEAFAICQRECARQLAAISSETDMTGRVRQELLSRPGYLHDIESIAGQLNLSTRTLRRRLAEQHTSFQDLQQQVRFQQARDYLKRPSLSVAEVATLLGFSEPGNFSQAFKRWSNGLSPRQFRQSLEGS